MKFEIESKFNVGDKVTWVGCSSSATVVALKLSNLADNPHLYEIIYLVEVEDLSRHWEREFDLRPCLEVELNECGVIMDIVNKNPLFNLDKTMEFNVVGDIKPVIKQILGEYEEWESPDCDVHLKGASGIGLPGYYPRMTYYSSFAKPKCRWIIAQLYKEGLIELHSVRD